MISWYNKSGYDTDVAIYTKITLARNIKGFPFPNRMTVEQIEKVNELVISAITADEELSKNFEIIEMEKLPNFASLALVERGLVSLKFISDKSNKILILSKDETVSIMLCGDDHIRINIKSVGMDLEGAFIKAESIDGVVCSALPIAFSDSLGFLTESPMELGTALRAEVLMHLPFMEDAGEIRGIADSVSRIGLNIKGITNTDGYNTASLYTLSNLITLGITERGAIENLSSIVNQVILRERAARKDADVISTEDSIFRALALLKSARRINQEEALELLSKVKAGISLDLIKGVENYAPYMLMVESGDGMLQQISGEMVEEDIDYARAEFLRKALANTNIN